MSLPPIEARADEVTGRSAEFDGLVEDIRRLYGFNPNLLENLEDVVRRRLGVPPMSVAAAVLAVLVGVGIRLAAVLLGTALAGQWTGLPWGRWAVVLAAYGLLDAVNAWQSSPRDPDYSSEPRWMRTLEEWTALVPRMVRESDLRELVDFARRWLRLRVALGVGVPVASIMLVACALVTPTALSELSAGSVVLLAVVLYDFGATPIYWGIIFNWAFTAREARYDHELFWPSPADAPEVRKAMRKTVVQGAGAGLYTTFYLVLAMVLVWGSPLVVPLGMGFIVIGYLAALGAAFGNRAAVRRIVERIRDECLAVLQRRIEAFGPRLADLLPEESQRLRDLLLLHDRIRDAPATPTATHTVMRATVGLIVPTIVFLVTVLSEVYAERIFDATLP